MFKKLEALLEQKSSVFYADVNGEKYLTAQQAHTCINAHGLELSAYGNALGV